MNISNLTRIVLFFCLINFFSSSAQDNLNPQKPWKWKTHSKWFYGKNNILVFDTTTYVVSTIKLTGSGSPFSTYEGCASACDEKGNLILLTNGVLLWDGNGNNIPVPGGRLLSGAEIPTGDMSSSAQGVLITKHPDNVNEYYIFTVDDAISGQSKTASFTNGFNYSIYNKVTNTVTKPKRIGNYRTTEQIEATFHKNGKDIWIAVHEALPLGSLKPLFTQRYNLYLLKDSGLDTIPVTSDLGFKVTVGSDWGGYSDRSNERGCFKFSTDGTKAAAVHHKGNGDISSTSECVTTMNFNNSTGFLSNSVAMSPNTISFSIPNSCEFSPDGNKLFVSYWSNIYESPKIIGRVEYYSLVGGTPVVVGSLSEGYNVGNIKLGADGNMYIGQFKDGNGWAYTDNLIKIGNPDGTPTWNATAISPGAGTVSYALPNIFLPPSNLNVITSINPIQTQTNIQVFPNPTTNNVNLIIENYKAQGEIQIQVVDLMGKQVLDLGNFTLNQNKFELQIHSQNFTKGLYFIRVNGVIQQSTLLVKQ